MGGEAGGRPTVERMGVRMLACSGRPRDGARPADQGNPVRIKGEAPDEAIERSE